MMPLTEKGHEIMGSMKKEYGAKKGEQVFYASRNKGTIKGVEKKKHDVAKRLKVGQEIRGRRDIHDYSFPVGGEIHRK